MTPSLTTIPSPCCPAPSRLDAYFDRELPDTERAQIDAHLQACPLCRQAVDQIAATSSLVKSIELPAMSQMGRARVLRQLTASAAAPHYRWLLPIRLLTAAAAAVFFLATALIVYQLHHISTVPGAGNIVHPVGVQHSSPGAAHIFPTATTNP